MHRRAQDFACRFRDRLERAHGQAQRAGTFLPGPGDDRSRAVDERIFGPEAFIEKIRGGAEACRNRALVVAERRWNAPEIVERDAVALDDAPRLDVRCVTAKRTLPADR